MVVVVVFQISFVACWKIYCTRTLNVVNNQQKEENQRLVRALVEHLFRVFVCCWLHFVLCIVLGVGWFRFIGWIFGCVVRSTSISIFLYFPSFCLRFFLQVSGLLLPVSIPG